MCIFEVTNQTNKMKTTFTLPQAIGFIKSILDFKTESTAKVVAISIGVFVVFAIIVLKFGHTIN